MAVSERIANSIVNYLDKQIWDALLRSNVGWMLIAKKGKKLMDLGSDRYQWTPLTERIPAIDYGDGTEIDFQRHREVSKAVQPYRQFVVPELLTNTELEQGHGAFAVAEVAKGVVDRVRDATISKLSKELYNDGGANTIAGVGLHGLESMMGATIDGTATLGVNNDTYAGISTARTAFTADANDDAHGAWSPAVVDATATAFGGSTDTWLDQCLEAIRLMGVNIQNKFGGRKEEVAVLMNQTDWVAFLTKLDTSFSRNNYSVNARDPDLVSLGFSDQVRWDGMTCHYDDYVPAGRAYGLNFMKSCIVCPSNKMIKVVKDQDLRYDGNLILAKFHGNFVFKLPATFGKIVTV